MYCTSGFPSDLLMMVASWSFMESLTSSAPFKSEASGKTHGKSHTTHALLEYRPTANSMTRQGVTHRWERVPRHMFSSVCSVGCVRHTVPPAPY